MAFEGLDPAASTAHARWATDAMRSRTGVARIVPDHFDAYVRILHPLQQASWSDEDPIYRRRSTPLDGRYPWPHPEPAQPAEGHLCDDAVDALAAILTNHTTTPSRCHYAVWRGWGYGSTHSQLIAGRYVPTPKPGAEKAVLRFIDRCATQAWWGGRDMFLCDGPLGSVSALSGASGLRRQSPQWWWPADHAWFVGNEIDDPWTYVAGTRRLVDDVARDTSLDVVACGPEDPW